LGTLGDPRAVRPILALLEGCDYDEEDNMLYYVTRVLGELRDKRAVGPLIRMLGHAQSSVRARTIAAITLGELGDGLAVEPLIEALEDVSVRVRLAAVHALGKLGDPRALRALERVQLHDEGETVEGDTVKKAAYEAIEQINSHLP
jgi:HEAT repeat protein